MGSSSTTGEQRDGRLYRYTHSLGWLQGGWYFCMEKLGRRDTVRVRTGSGTFRLRLNTTDILVLYSVFERQDYRTAPLFSPGWIVDAGAYTGFSAVYFAQRFPQARIIAIEPVRSNYEILLENIASYPQITPINKALWFENAQLEIHERGTGAWGYATRPAGAAGQIVGHTDTITMDQILQKFAPAGIGLLKLDIEGAEKEVLENSASWIGQVDAVAVELHDRFKAGCSAASAATTRDMVSERRRGPTLFKARSGNI
jgi:FkbM family methyltransferase